MTVTPMRQLSHLQGFFSTPTCPGHSHGHMLTQPAAGPVPGTWGWPHPALCASTAAQNQVPVLRALPS